MGACALRSPTPRGQFEADHNGLVQFLPVFVRITRAHDGAVHDASLSPAHPASQRGLVDLRRIKTSAQASDPNIRGCLCALLVARLSYMTWRLSYGFSPRDYCAR